MPENDKKDIFDKIMSLPILNKFYNIYAAHKEALLYLFFGGLSFLLNTILYYITTDILSIDIIIANIVTWIIVVSFCFFTNRTFVFNDRSKPILKQITYFYAARIITLLIENAILFIFIKKLELNNMIVKITAQIIIIIINYIFSKLIIFNKKDDDK